MQMPVGHFYPRNGERYAVKLPVGSNYSRYGKEYAVNNAGTFTREMGRDMRLHWQYITLTEKREGTCTEIADKAGSPEKLGGVRGCHHCRRRAVTQIEAPGAPRRRSQRHQCQSHQDLPISHCNI